MSSDLAATSPRPARTAPASTAGQRATLAVRMFATISRITVSDDRQTVHAIAHGAGGTLEVRAPVRYHHDDGDGLAGWTGPGAVLLAVPAGRSVEIRGALSLAPATVLADAIITTRSAAHAATVTAFGTVVPTGSPVRGWWPGHLHLPGQPPIPAHAQLPGPRPRSGQWAGVLTLGPLELHLRPAGDRCG